MSEVGVLMSECNIIVICSMFLKKKAKHVFGFYKEMSYFIFRKAPRVNLQDRLSF
ncbi:hypothetical protein SAMN04515667_2187 [Formosa sp. Hel1_31_208]|nr:hypothetical protein SAMN04515667_2187 [Formosa sp. Hel1_31_208]